MWVYRSLLSPVQARPRKRRPNRKRYKGASRHRRARLFWEVGVGQAGKEGGLMSYGPETTDIFRRSAWYVDRILKGAKPAELPVQTPVKYEFVINRKTATTLGLTVPLRVHGLADEVIE